MALERSFNMDADCEGFEEYISGLREDVRDPSQAPPLGENHPTLYLLRPTTRRAPRQWLHLGMVTGNAEIILWIRTDNLYVVGFEQVQEAGGARYEFGTDPKNDAKKKKDKEKKAKKKKDKEDETAAQPLIEGATFLGFDGGYTDLGELQSGPEPRQEYPFLGWHPLDAAIRGLAAYTPEAPRGARGWLRTIIVTVSESLRLHNVCQFMDGLLRECRSDWLTQEMISCIHAWGDISVCVITSARDPDGDAHGRYDRLSQNGICTDTDGACTLVAILNAGAAADDDKDKPGPSRPKREAGTDEDGAEAAADDADADQDAPESNADQDAPEANADEDDADNQGLTFVEIFSAVVQGPPSTGRNTQLYGHIVIDDGLTSQLLFMRGRSKALPLSADGHVELTGPERAAWGYGEIVMHVDLMDAVPGAVDMTPDDEVASGKLVWNTYDTPRMVYDEVEEYVFEGDSGALNVRCAVITNAVVATVALRYTGRTCQKDVYGTIYAATTMFGPEDKVTLFDRGEWKDAVSVGAGELVPLLRNVSVVPLLSSLKICADLWNRAYVADMSVDEQISSGAVPIEFAPSPFGVVWEVIGDNSDFEVGVTWSLN